ncbi:lasso peptide biosynthesis B2 protein [Longimicrobium sp.]|uniref:lasso peptide biosynthesis B2 protein n=1 Tax=Longimicrobium sp. TaxID=2029185 RepID=UPI002B70FCC7|nr:lasso peptide biosynthesis B2 protein [Longimicrobium sp.]HSU15794.1 lasso peptide biosynthesis B2 protein [Longimicrobium sp.]
MRTPSVARCALELLAVRACLKARGFGRAVAWARRRASAASGPGLAPDEVERAAYHVAVAAAFFPGRAVCLEQSLALFVLLRRRGAPAELRIGVQVYPFYAHAWVELDGRPVNEDQETVEKFRALPEVAA